tara:strand:+ start:224 stop:520 length:297 start_codon:yes stop_codon:yes gene_type:complete
MKKLCISFSAVILLLSACSTHSHVIGDGPQTGVSTTARQYYILFGLVPLNKVDTNSMIDGATNYQLETGQQGVDVLISMAAGLIIPTTVSSRTVKVTK